MSNQKMLVIGLGNPLRGDDGVGIWVAEHIAAANWPGVMAVALESSDPTTFFSGTVSHWSILLTQLSHRIQSVPFSG